MTDEELRRLVERAHRLRKLAETPDWQLLKEQMTKQIEAKNRALLNGNAKTLEDYRAMAGWIQGAEAVLGAADALERQVEVAREQPRAA